MAAQATVPSNMTVASERAWLAKIEAFPALPRPALARNGLARHRIRHRRPSVDTFSAMMIALTFPLLCLPLFMSHILVGSIVLGVLLAFVVSLRKAYGFLAEYFPVAYIGLSAKLKCYLTLLLFNGACKLCAGGQGSSTHYLPLY